MPRNFSTGCNWRPRMFGCLIVKTAAIAVGAKHRPVLRSPMCAFCSAATDAGKFTTPTFVMLPCTSDEFSATAQAAGDRYLRLWYPKGGTACRTPPHHSKLLYSGLVMPRRDCLKQFRTGYVNRFHAGDFLTLGRDEFRVTLHRVCGLLGVRRVLFDRHCSTSMRSGSIVVATSIVNENTQLAGCREMPASL
jgi:hypothetical protein